MASMVSCQRWRDGDGGFVLACGKSLDCTLCPNLVGGIPTPLKNMSSSVGMIIPNIWIMMGKSFKIPWFQSPPTSNPSHISHDLVHGHPIDSYRMNQSRHPRHRCRDRSLDVEHTPVAIDALGHQSNQQHSCFNG